MTRTKHRLNRPLCCAAVASRPPPRLQELHAAISDKRIYEDRLRALLLNEAIYLISSAIRNQRPFVFVHAR